MEEFSGDESSTTEYIGPEGLEQATELADIEATQLELRERLAGPQLDHRFAAIEEQFRDSFDERLRAASASSAASAGGSSPIGGCKSGLSSSAPHHHRSTDVEVLVTSRVMREVARLMADEWRPVFDALTARFDPQIVDGERRSLEMQPRLIQGYKALLKWKQLCADDQQFDIWQLVDALRRSDMDDIAELARATLENREQKNANDNNKSILKATQRRKSDVSSSATTKPKFLDDRRMLHLAKQVGSDWERLGKALGVLEDELSEIREDIDGSSHHGAFKMLWSWRESVQSDELSGAEMLRKALQSVDKAHLIDQLTEK